MLKRDDLWVERQVDSDGDTVRAGHRKVSDAELAELIESMGYVKASYPESMTLTDWQALLAEAAESVAREWMEKDGGWVKRPVCGECDGGMQWHRPDPAYPMAEIMGRTCPSCGGTGFGRLVALDGIDVEALTLAVKRFERTLRLATDSPDRESNEALWGAYQHDVNTLLGPARQVLAAIDQEDT